MWSNRPPMLLWRSSCSLVVALLCVALAACPEQKAADAGARKVVATSSIAVFGGQGLDRDATGSSPFALGATGNLYAQTKYEAHQVALELAREGVDVTLVAPTGPFGPGDIRPTPTGRLLLDAVRFPPTRPRGRCRLPAGASQPRRVARPSQIPASAGLHVSAARS